MLSDGRMNVLSRIDELKELFQIGQKTLLFFDGLFQFYQDVIPLLEGINESIEESSSKLPHASTSLHQVSKATETATIEILDTLETMSVSIEEAQKQFEEFMACREKRSDAFGEFLTYLENLSQKLSPEDAAMLRTMTAKIIVEGSEDDKRLSLIRNYFGKAAEYTANITISLQVQDITSQQLAAVNHLVESVHERLKHLLENFDNVEIEAMSQVIKKKNVQTSFDPNAEYTRSTERQDLADSLSKKHNEISLNKPDGDGIKETGCGQNNSMTTQEEIDKLFGK